ncbi:LytR/AlgR family response regulator transcription factor [Haloactinomyces albus]|uniref:DNA-binding LytR/AlgR family response regulator n=1 Tax=Haloactinomyces albus TaxID=1352928 RepID=A0AAE3ZE72_9ACTN|nr:LytTR family DNA-binding domain-containing protein [Haloactinomyces albus]MDR7301924.1 DNA-binding LytR/AlgR family response regulator [Haloactinomyces albus]
MSTQEHVSGLVVLAVDDEIAGLNEMKHLLECNPRVSRVVTASDAPEALHLLRGGDKQVRTGSTEWAAVDAVFADVAMPGLSGMELARAVVSYDNPPALVFITGHEENALEAFELGAIDYIMKPANPERVDRALRFVERVSDSSAEKENRVESGRERRAVEEQDTDPHAFIAVELGGTTKLIPRKSVLWVEAQGDYARLHTTDGSYLVRIPLAQLEEQWADAGFVRIHRSYLVALGLVSELRTSSSGHSVLLRTGGELRELPVSRRHTRELKNRLVHTPRPGWG